MWRGQAGGWTQRAPPVRIPDPPPPPASRPPKVFEPVVLQFEILGERVRAKGAEFFFTPFPRWYFFSPYPPPPVSKNHLVQEPNPGSAVEFSHHFFYQGSGFFMFVVDVGQLFRWTSWMMMQSPSILTSQNPSLSLSRSQLQRRLQHRSLAPRGSTDRNSGWCITGRRVSGLSQLNNRSSHARWKSHYSPVS